MGCPTSCSTWAATSWPSLSAKLSMPAGWGMSGWSSSSGRTSGCWSGSPRRTFTSSGLSCCPPR
eukprot:9134212-Alexandrium_andersonii.AAC.1